MGVKVRVESFLPAVAAAQGGSPLSKVCFIFSLVGTPLSTPDIVANLFIWHGRLSCPVKPRFVICTTVPFFTLCDTIRGDTTFAFIRLGGQRFRWTRNAGGEARTDWQTFGGQVLGESRG